MGNLCLKLLLAVFLLQAGACNKKVKQVNKDNSELSQKTSVPTAETSAVSGPCSLSSSAGTTTNPELKGHVFTPEGQIVDFGQGHAKDVCISKCVAAASNMEKSETVFCLYHGGEVASIGVDGVVDYDNSSPASNENLPTDQLSENSTNTSPMENATSQINSFIETDLNPQNIPSSRLNLGACILTNTEDVVLTESGGYLVDTLGASHNTLNAGNTKLECLEKCRIAFSNNFRGDDIFYCHFDGKRVSGYTRIKDRKIVDQAISQFLYLGFTDSQARELMSSPRVSIRHIKEFSNALAAGLSIGFLDVDIRNFISVSNGQIVDMVAIGGTIPIFKNLGFSASEIKDIINSAKTKTEHFKYFNAAVRDATAIGYSKADIKQFILDTENGIVDFLFIARTIPTFLALGFLSAEVRAMVSSPKTQTEHFRDFNVAIYMSRSIGFSQPEIKDFIVKAENGMVDAVWIGMTIPTFLGLGYSASEVMGIINSPKTKTEHFKDFNKAIFDAKSINFSNSDLKNFINASENGMVDAVIIGRTIPTFLGLGFSPAEVAGIINSPKTQTEHFLDFNSTVADAKSIGFLEADIKNYIMTAENGMVDAVAIGRSIPLLREIQISDTNILEMINFPQTKIEHFRSFPGAYKKSKELGYPSSEIKRMVELNFPVYISTNGVRWD